MKRRVLIASIAFLTSALCQAELFLRWGDEPTNRTLYKKGGVHSYDPNATQLHPSPNAQLNDEVISQVRQWYHHAERKDLAGPGLYFSSGLDSDIFGNDLMLVEVKSRGPLDQVISAAHTGPEIANSVLHGPASEVRPIYRFNRTWHVAPRTPDPKDGLEIKFRQPQADDVSAFFKQLTEDDAYRAGKLLKIAREQPSDWTPRTKAFFERIRYDEAVAYLVRSFDKLPPGSNPSSELLHTMNNTLSDFSRTRPGDRQVVGVYVARLRQRLTVPDDFVRSGWIPFTKTLFPELSSADKARIAEVLFDPKQLHSFQRELPALLSMLPDFRPHLPEAQAAAWHKGAVSLDLARIPELALRPADLPALMREFGRERILPFLKQGMASELVHLARLSKADASASASLDFVIAAAKGVFHSDPGEFERILRLSLKEALKTPGRTNLFVTAGLGSVFAIDDPVRRDRLIRELYPEFRKVMPLTAHMETELGILAQSRLDARTLKAVLDGMHRLFGLPDDISIPSMGLTGGQFVERHLDDALKLPDNVAIRNAHGSVPYNEFKDRLPLAKYERSRMAMLRPTRTTAYSAVSPIFSLVDPIIVSDDIRANNAAFPHRRFDESFVDVSALSGRTKHDRQPVWASFSQAWSDSTHYFANLPAANQDERRRLLERMVRGVHESAFAHGVEGNVRWKGSREWDRSKYTTFISDHDWAALGGDAAREELQSFFDIRQVHDGKELRFRTLPDLQNRRSGLNAFDAKPGSPAEAEALVRHIVSEVEKIRDPIKRAARVLHLFPKLHPFQNGNGRTGRIWAMAELTSAGYPIPVGLPTNDFLMTERRMELEVRKAVALGRMWRNMLREAEKDRIPFHRFFQDRFRGSDLEGLVHVTPIDDAELETYVAWLEKQDAPPSWGREFMKHLEPTLQQMTLERGSLGAFTESQRYFASRDLFRSFRESRGSGLFTTTKCGLMRALRRMATPPGGRVDSLTIPQQL